MDLKKSDYKKIKRVGLDLSELREIKPLSFVDTLAELVKQERFIGPQGPAGESIVGPKGDKGDSIIGPQGIPGDSIVGPQGRDGNNGVDGARGSIWLSGHGKPKKKDGVNVNDYYLDVDTGDVYKKDVLAWVNVGNIRGPKGLDGKNGVDGKSIVGPKGEKGKDGKSIEGKPGKNGVDGQAPAHQWSGTKLRFKNPDGTWGEWTELRGLQAKFVRGASETTIINNGGGTEVFTKTVGPGLTVNLDQFVTAEIRQVEYFINILDSTDSKRKGLKLFVLKTDLTASTQIYARAGDEIPVSIDASFSGLNTNVFLTNNSLNTLEIKYSRILI